MKFIFQLFILSFILISCSKIDGINGKKVFNLKDEEFTLDTKKSKLSVFYFLAPECPLSQNYSKSINEIYTKYINRDVQFYAVFSGVTYTDDEMKSYIEDYKIKIGGIKDENYSLAKYFKASITPEVFLLDENENLIYTGKIDNWIESLGVKRQIVTEFYLVNAIDKYLQGEEIIINKTEAVGCVLE